MWLNSKVREQGSGTQAIGHLLKVADDVGVALLQRQKGAQGDVHQAVQAVVGHGGRAGLLGAVPHPDQLLRLGQALPAASWRPTSRRCARIRTRCR